MNTHDLFARMPEQNIKDCIADILNVDPSALELFEDAYKRRAIEEPSDNLFDVDAAKLRENIKTAQSDACPPEIIERAVAELAADTPVLKIENGETRLVSMPALPNGHAPLSKNDLSAIAPEARPQATGSLMQLDVSGPPSSLTLVSLYELYRNGPNERVKKSAYRHFRQGLDTLDLDPVLYAILDKNPNAMSRWLPPVAKAAYRHGFFQVPATRIAKVPMPLLQLSRIDYGTLTPATIKILNLWAMYVFGLDVSKDYFVKTGTFSSKFDFRNAHVTGEKEVRELGEYLLFIQNQAVIMAAPLAQPSIFGASTTNEWVVRDFIPAPPDTPTIYKGLPLRPEYRVFADFDTEEILGMSPYWAPSLMKTRFAGMNDASSVHNRHDYVIYAMRESYLTAAYEANKDRVANAVKALIPDAAAYGLSGQWSVDIMQNGDTFWLIDMGTADTSALSNCVPPGKLHRTNVEWMLSQEQIKALLQGD